MITPLLLLWLWGKMLKQLLDAFVEVLDVLVGLAGKCVRGTAPPDQILRFGVKKVDHERPDFVGIDCGC